MNRYVILVALALPGSTMAQSAAAPQCDNKIVAGFNKQAGQYQLWLGDAQETIEALQSQVADLTKKLAEKATPAGPAPTVSPPK